MKILLLEWPTIFLASTKPVYWLINNVSKERFYSKMPNKRRGLAWGGGRRKGGSNKQGVGNLCKI